MLLLCVCVSCRCPCLSPSFFDIRKWMCLYVIRKSNDEKWDDNNWQHISWQKKKWLNKNEWDQPRHLFGNDRQRFIDDEDDDIVVAIVFAAELLLYYSHEKLVFKRNISFRLLFDVFISFFFGHAQMRCKKRKEKYNGNKAWVSWIELYSIHKLKLIFISIALRKCSQPNSYDCLNPSQPCHSTFTRKKIVQWSRLSERRIKQK